MDINITTQNFTTKSIADLLAAGEEVNLHDDGSYAVTMKATDEGLFHVTDTTGRDAEVATADAAMDQAADFIFSVNGEPEAPDYSNWNDAIAILTIVVLSALTGDDA